MFNVTSFDALIESNAEVASSIVFFLYISMYIIYRTHVIAYFSNNRTCIFKFIVGRAVYTVHRDIAKVYKMMNTCTRR